MFGLSFFKKSLEKQERRDQEKLHGFYTLLYEDIKDLEVVGGLCFRIAVLIEKHNLSTIDDILIFNHFKSQKPSRTQHSEFLNNNWSGQGFWWYYCGTEDRKAFIRKMIEITRPTGL